MLDEGHCTSRADLALKLGVSRPRVTQLLGLLDLAPDVLEAVVGLGDPLSDPAVTERSLRPLLKRARCDRPVGLTERTATG